MFLKYKVKKDFINNECKTDCPFKGSYGTKVGSVACGQCGYYKFKIPFLKVIFCKHKRLNK